MSGNEEKHIESIQGNKKLVTNNEYKGSGISLITRRGHPPRSPCCCNAKVLLPLLCKGGNGPVCCLFGLGIAFVKRVIPWLAMQWVCVFLDERWD